jgi:hypothetical protein
MASRLGLFSPPLHERYPVRKAVSRLLPDRQYATLAFWRDHGRFPRTPPVSFNERLSDLIGSGRSEQYAPYCDKLAVRDFVAREAGAKYLVPLHAAAESLTPDLWDRLPPSFMLKPNHGSSWFWLIRDKSRERFDRVSAVAGNWLRMNYYHYYRERQYANIRPALLFEHVLNGDRVDDLVDFKFFCFHGTAQMVYVLNQRPSKSRLLYDLNWNKLRVRYKVSNEGHYPRPAALEEMRSVAETLARGFDFVRVDMFSVAEGVFFGELTFTPLAGSDRFDPTEFDDYLGQLWGDPEANRLCDFSPWRDDAPRPDERLAG